MTGLWGVARGIGRKRMMTVAEFMADWLETVIKPNRRPNTYRHHEAIIRLHIVPSLGAMPLDALDGRIVQRFVSDVAAKGLAPDTVRQVIGVLQAGLNRAVAWGLIVANPARRPEFPQRNHDRRRPFTPTELPLFLRAARGERLEALFIMGVTVGPRRGEMLGLMWQDIDWQARTARIERALVVSGSKMTLGGLKTPASRRTVPLSASLVAALRAHRERQATEAIRAGTRDWQNLGLIFPGRTGGYLSESTIRAAYHRVLRRGGLPMRRIHDMRHTACSAMIRAGLNPKTVQAIMGHANMATTLAVYTHVTGDDVALAGEAMERLLASMDGV